VEKYKDKVDKDKKEVFGNWVWMHLRKSKFPNQRKSKLQARGDDPFQVLRKINNHAYELDFSW